MPERADQGTDQTTHWMDYCVMLIGGKEGTTKAFLDLLDQAGLGRVKTWCKETSAHVVIEAKAKDVQHEDQI